MQDHGSVLDEGTGRSQGYFRYQHRDLPEADPQLVERGHFAVVKKLTSQLRVYLDVAHSLSPRLSGMVFSCSAVQGDVQYSLLNANSLLNATVLYVTLPLSGRLRDQPSFRNSAFPPLARL